MPLDTRCTIEIEAIGTRDDTGVYIPGDTTSYPVWADEMKSRDDDHLETAGARTIQIRHFRVRYFRALATANVALVSLTDALGREWNPDSVDLSDERRRFILIRGTREFSAEDTGGTTNGESETETETELTPSDSSLALAPTEQAGIRRYARTENMVETADFYENGFARRMRATFVNDEVITLSINGPRGTFSADTTLDDSEINDSGDSVGDTGREFYPPDSMPSQAELYFFIYWIDRSTDGSPEPDSVISIEFV